MPHYHYSWQSVTWLLGWKQWLRRSSGKILVKTTLRYNEGGISLYKILISLCRVNVCFSNTLFMIVSQISLISVMICYKYSKISSLYPGGHVIKYIKGQLFQRVSHQNLGVVYIYFIKLCIYTYTDILRKLVFIMQCSRILL